MSSYREHLPCAALRPAITGYWANTTSAPHRLLPDGAIDLLFRRASPTDAWAGSVVGAMTRSMVTPGARGDFIGVRFRPGEAAPFLGLPASALTDRIVPLDALDAPWARSLGARLDEVSGLDAAVVELDTALAAVRPRAPDPRVRAAVSSLEARVGSVAAAADAVCLSPRQLQRLFEAHVGLSAKRAARIFRLQRALALRRPPTRSWAEIAVTVGYADQAHLIRDFKDLAGAGPTQLESEASGSFKTGQVELAMLDV